MMVIMTLAKKIYSTPWNMSKYAIFFRCVFIFEKIAGGEQINSKFDFLK